jgi:hypothetical protein
MRDVVAAAFLTTESVRPNLEPGRYLTDKSRAAFLRDEASATRLTRRPFLTVGGYAGGCRIAGYDGGGASCAVVCV